MQLLTKLTVNKSRILANRELTDYDGTFYFNQMNNGIDLRNTDRYTNLNTVLGYDVGIIKSYIFTYSNKVIEFVSIICNIITSHDR